VPPRASPGGRPLKSLLDWLIGATLLVFGALRALLRFGRAGRMRTLVLWLTALGLLAAVLGVAHHPWRWLLVPGLLTGFGPLSVWGVVSWLSDEGPPADLRGGPEFLDEAEERAIRLFDTLEPGGAPDRIERESRR
jgi:hypothetical protein